MRKGLVLVSVFIVFSCYSQNTILESTHSYYINYQNDTNFGLVKFNRYARSFRFIPSQHWDAQAITLNDAKTVCRMGQVYQIVPYKKKERFLRQITTQVDTIYIYRKKKDRFFVDVPKKMNYRFFKGRNPNMKLRYKVVSNSQTYHITRYNYRDQLNVMFLMPKELASNCTFRDFVMDANNAWNYL